MPNPKELQALSIEELRSVARDYQLPKVDTLSKATLLQHLESILKYEALSVRVLQDLAKERGFSSIAKLKKRQLTRLNHRFDVVSSRTADELRRHATELAIPLARKLTKSKLVVAYLELEIASLNEEAHTAKPSEQRASTSTIFHPPSSPRKTPRTTRWFGTLLKISSAFFLGLTTLGILLLPLLIARTINPSRSWLSRTRSTVEGTNNVIDDLSMALDDTIEAIDSSATSLQSVSKVLDASEPLIESTSVLLGTALPDSIRATQEGLQQAEESAKALDQVLRGLAALGPLTGVRYNPDLPLHEGIAETADGLDPLPEALIDVRDQLVVATTDLDELSQNLRATAADMRRLTTDIKGQETLLISVRSFIENFSEILEQAEQRLPTIFWIAGLGVEILLIGFATTQAAVFAIGKSLIEQGKEHFGANDY